MNQYLQAGHLHKAGKFPRAYRSPRPRWSTEYWSKPAELSVYNAVRIAAMASLVVSIRLTVTELQDHHFRCAQCPLTVKIRYSLGTTAKTRQILAGWRKRRAVAECVIAGKQCYSGGRGQDSREPTVFLRSFGARGRKKRKQEVPSHIVGWTFVNGIDFSRCYKNN